jgi:hypothetical protein
VRLNRSQHLPFVRLSGTVALDYNLSLLLEAQTVLRYPRDSSRKHACKGPPRGHILYLS